MDEDDAVAALMGLTSQGERSIERFISEAADRNEEIREAGEISLSKKPFHDSKRSSKKKGKANAFTFPVQPRVVQVIKMPKTYVDHTYRDFSSVPPEPGYREPPEISQMTFAQKLHHMLSQSEYSDCINWLPHGRAFRIISPKMMEQTRLLQTYYGHNRYSGFLMELKKYGLKLMTGGRDSNCYYHEFMLRGLPHLGKYMPPFKACRRLVPDPDNEPDFYTISLLWPLPLKSPEAPETPLAASNDSEATHIMSNEMLMSLFSSSSQEPSALKSVGSIRAPLPKSHPQAQPMVSSPPLKSPRVSLAAANNSGSSHTISDEMLMRSLFSAASQKPSTMAPGPVRALPMFLPQPPSFLEGLLHDATVANNAAVLIAAALRNPIQPLTQNATVGGNAAIAPATLRQPVYPQAQDTHAASNAALIAAALQNPDWLRWNIR